MLATRRRVAVVALAVCVGVWGVSEAGKARNKEVHGAVATDTGAAPAAGDFGDAKAYIDAHNAVRAGVKKPAGYAAQWQPISPVVWSDEIARTSQAWAEHL